MKPSRDFAQAPITELRLVTNNYGMLWWLIKIKCPYCGKPHNHGGGTDPKPDLGHRGAHCLTTERRPDYLLTFTDSTVIVADDETKYAEIRQQTWAK